MRAGSFSLTIGFPLLILACGGDDLLLPGDEVPARLRMVSGDLQEGLTGVTLPDPLVVEAFDRSGRPVVGSRILFRFQAATEGAQVNPDTALTDASGQATAEVRLGQAPGGHPVEAIVVDADTNLAVRFVLTALTRPESGPTGGGDADDGDDGDDGDDADDGDDVDDGEGNGDDDGGGNDGKGKGKGGKGKDD